MKYLNKLSILIIVFGLATILVNPVFVYAQQTGNNASPSQQSSTAAGLPTYNAGVDQSISDYLCTPSQPADGHDLERCVNRLYRFSITAGSIVVVFFIVLAGYMYITGGETGKGKGKAMLFNALTGLAIILTSYVLLYFINPSLVVIKPIQPPIFTADDLPSCEEVGLGADCITNGGEDSPGNAGTVLSGGRGLAVPCTTGLVSVKSLDVATKSGDLQICKSLGVKLQAAYKLSGTSEKWRATATIDRGHTSNCHVPVHPQNGNCVDIGTGDGDRSTDRWDKICAAFKQQGGVSIANEIAPKSASGAELTKYSTPNCGPAKDKSTKAYLKASDAPSIHVNYIGS